MVLADTVAGGGSLALKIQAGEGDRVLGSTGERCLGRYVILRYT